MAAAGFVGDVSADRHGPFWRPGHDMLDSSAAPRWSSGWVVLLVGLSALAARLLTAAGFPRGLTSNLLFYFPLAAVAVWTVLAIEGHEQRWDRCLIGWRAIGGTALAASACFWLVGWYFTVAAGYHSGDEAHYVKQAESLYRDGDLDLRDDLSDVSPDATALHRSHISQLSGDGHWYSWHPFGLSLWLAPWVGGGTAARHLALGLLAGLGCGAMLALCRLCGARPTGSWIVSGLFAASLYWGVYACRALPETMGATLTLVLVCAALARGRCPWAMAGVSALCAAALPWVHTRFIPVALLGACLYVVLAWRDRKSATAGAAIECAILGTITLASAAGYLWQHGRMFGRFVPYPMEGVAFSYPLGMWHILASRSGVLYVLPLFAWLLAAAVMGPWRSGYRFRASVPPVFLAAVLATSAATPHFVGGASLPGRFLLVVAPLLVSPAAVAFGSATRVARVWLVFLGLVSCAQFALLLARLPAIGNGFRDPAGALRETVPALAGLWTPFRSAAESVFHPGAVALFAVTALLLIPRRRECDGAGSEAACIAAGVTRADSAATARPR
jgi:hypothetical protein